MSQTATFEVGIAGVDRPAAGTRGAVMAPGGRGRIRPAAVAGVWERLRSDAVCTG